MENTLLTPRHSVVARVIASSVVALMGISGLAVPASANGVDPVVPVSALASADVVSGPGGNTLALTTGKAAIELDITATPIALAADAVIEVMSSDANIAIEESATAEGGVAKFTVSSSSATTVDNPLTLEVDEAESAVLTFSVQGRDDITPLVVNVTVTDPALKTDLPADLTSLDIRYGTSQTITISSTELGLPADAEVTGVSTDSDLVAVTAEPIVENVESTNSVTPVGGKATFTITALGLTPVYELGDTIPDGKNIGDDIPETITFRSLNYQDVVVPVTTFAGLNSTSFTSDSRGVYSLSLTTGTAAVTAEITSALLALTDTDVVSVQSSDASITIGESAVPANGVATFNISGSSATTEAAVLTFSVDNRPTLAPIEVNVTVVDPALKTDLATGVTSIDMVRDSTRTITISSDVLGLPADAEVTGVSTDSDLIAVTAGPIVDGVEPTNAVAPVDGSATFTITALGLTPVYELGDTIPEGFEVGDAIPETITFRSLNYKDVAVSVTTFAADALKSASFVKQNDVNTLSLLTGAEAVTARISAYLALTAADVVSVQSSDASITIEESAIPALGRASFNISGSSATNVDDPTTVDVDEAEPAVLTFSVDNRPNTPSLVVYVTVTDPALETDLAPNVTNLDIRVGSTQTVTISSTELGLPADAEVTGVSTDSDLVAVTAEPIVENVESTNSVTPVGGEAAFTITALGLTPVYELGDTLPSGKNVGDDIPETITFRSLNYQDVVVSVSTFDELKSSDFTEEESGQNTLALVTGTAAVTAEISAYLALTAADVVSVQSSDASITIEESAIPANGIATFNISGSSATNVDDPTTLAVNEAEPAVLTFSAAGRSDLVVYVTVTDPALETDLDADVTNLDIRVGSTQTVTISSSALGLPADAEVTGVSTDSDLVAVTAEPIVENVESTNSVTPVGGEAAFTITALGLTPVYELGDTLPSGKNIGDAIPETITFRSLNYQDVVVSVSTFDQLKSSDFTEEESGQNTLALVTGTAAVTAEISAYFALTAADVVSVQSSDASITIEESAIPANGIATFNISGSSATTEAAVLTFSVDNRPGLRPMEVYVTVIDPELEADETSLEIRVGSTQTVTISSSALGLPADAEVTGVSTDSDLVAVTAGPIVENVESTNAVNPVNGNATFTITALGLTPVYELGDTLPSGKNVGDDIPETITFRSLNYQDVVVSVATFDELKSSDFTEGESGAKTLELFVGANSVSAAISAYQTLADAETVTATSSNPAFVTVTPSATPTAGAATFTIAPVSAGSAELTFSAPGREDLVVAVNVVAPYLAISESATEDLAEMFAGQSKQVEIGFKGAGGKATMPNDVVITGVAGLGTDTGSVSVQKIGTSSQFTVTGVTAGSASVTFSAPGFTSVVLDVEVSKGELATEETFFDLYASQSVTFDVASEDFPISSAGMLFDAVIRESEEDPAVEASVETVPLLDENGVAIPGKFVAQVTIKGLIAGDTAVTISDQAGNYVPVEVEVAVATPSLTADSSSYEMFYGQSVVVTVASDEIELGASEMDKIVVTPADDTVVSLDNPATEDVVEGPTFVEGSGYEFVFYGLAAGSSEVVFSREDGFAPVTVNVTVEAPELVAELDLSTIFIGDIANVVVSSDEQAISEADLALIEAVASNEEAVSVTPGDVGADNNSVALTIEGLTAGSSTITLSIPNYAPVLVQITVATPALKTDVTSIRAFIGLPTVIEVSSDDKVLENAVTATTKVGLAIGEDCTGENTGEGVSEGEITKVTLCGVEKGSYLVTLTADNYAPVIVRVIVVAPSLKSEVTKVEIFSGSIGEIQISSDDLALTSDIKVTAANTPGITFVNEDNLEAESDNEAFGSDEGLASFKFTASTPGAYRVNFNSTGFKQVGVLVVVVRPELTSDVASVSVNNGGLVEFTVSSSDIDLADTLVLDAAIGDEELGSAEVTSVSNGEAVVSFIGTSIGKSAITVTAPNFKPVVVRVTVLPTRLELDVDSFTSVVHGVTRVTVTSPDSSVFDPTTLEALASKEGIVEVTPYVVESDENLTAEENAALTPQQIADLSSEDSEPGKAVFDIKGLAKGSTRISFTGEGFTSASVSVKINTALLLANTSNMQLFAGQTSEESPIVISSPDLSLTEELALNFEASPGAAIEVGDIVYEEGVATVTIKGTAKGRDKLVVSGEGFKAVSVSVNIVEAALVTNVSSVSFRADGSAIVKVSSKDLPLSEEFDPMSLELLGGGALEGLVTVGEVVDFTDGVATITLIAPDVAERLSGTLTIKAENYKGKTLKVTVAPTPVCVDKALGQIKFGNDAKLSSAAKSSIAKFAAELVDNKCVGTTLTSYVPAANTKANAAKYAKELQLASSREAAVSSALTAAILKLRADSEIVVTVVRGTVPTSVLNGSAAAQASYRRIDVAANSTIETARSFKLRRLI